MYTPTTLRRSSPAKIRKAVERVVRQWQPVKVIQFGSNAQPGGLDDEVHLLVIMERCPDKRSMIADILDELGDAGFSKEILVATVEELQGEPNLGSIVPVAVKEGKVLYDRTPG